MIKEITKQIKLNKTKNNWRNTTVKMFGLITLLTIFKSLWTVGIKITEKLEM